MPRTATKKRKDNRTPLEVYEALDHHKQLICWNYYRFIETNGEEGWNPKEPGSVHHQRSSAYLLSLGSDSWFRHLGKQMVTLAEKFAAVNQSPHRPIGAPPTTPVQEEPRSFREATPPPMVPPVSKNHGLGLTSPRAARREAVPRFSEPPADHGPEPSLPAPTSFGMWKKFNYTNRTTTTQMLIRLILHNGVEMQDIQFEWITPRKLKLNVAWPEWFQYAEQMAEFTTDDEGKPVYPTDHQLTMDTSERNQALVKQEDNRIWDEGFLTFDQDMKSDDPTFELLSVEIPSKATKVNVLQILVE
jgi:hypothetical protein